MYNDHDDDDGGLAVAAMYFKNIIKTDKKFNASININKKKMCHMR